MKLSRSEKLFIFTLISKFFYKSQTKALKILIKNPQLIETLTKIQKELEPDFSRLEKFRKSSEDPLRNIAIPVIDTRTTKKNQMDKMLGKRQSSGNEIEITDETVKMSYKELLERRKKLKMGDSYNQPKQAPQQPTTVSGGMGMMSGGHQLPPINPNFNTNFFMGSVPQGPIIQPQMMPVMPQQNMMPQSTPVMQPGPNFGQNFYSHNPSNMAAFPPIGAHPPSIPGSFGFLPSTVLPDTTAGATNGGIGMINNPGNAQMNLSKDQFDTGDFVFKKAN